MKNLNLNKENDLLTYLAFLDNLKITNDLEKKQAKAELSTISHIISEFKKHDLKSKHLSFMEIKKDKLSVKIREYEYLTLNN